MRGHNHPLVMCPDCQAGKHGNCLGDAWCIPCDLPHPCECEDHGPT